VAFLLIVAAQIAKQTKNSLQEDTSSSTTSERGLGERVRRRLIDLLNTRRRFYSAVGVFVFGIVTAPVGIELLHWRGRDELRTFINEHHPDVFVVGQQMKDSAEYLDMLSATHFVFAHHSHPTVRIPIRLVARNGEKLNLILAQDSEIAIEFWVYLSPYGMSKNDTIGRTYTTLLRRK
jgi:hypothetical protein